jgi:hypothetical protein
MKKLFVGVLLAAALPIWGADATAPVTATPAAENTELQPAVNTSATATPAPRAAPKVTPKPTAPGASTTRNTNTSGPAVDRLELDTTQITGNRELPRVLYVVPWKRSDLGDLTGRPANSLLDEVLAPVDRDVFRRQNKYYEALRPDTTGVGSGGASEGEK